MTDRKTCPICGGRCTEYAWSKWRHCTSCNSLLTQGYTVDKVRIKRREQEIEDHLSDINSLPEMAELEARYERNRYDFYEKFPDGINIIVNDRKEANILKRTYDQFSQFEGIIDTFKVNMETILQFTLEKHRNSIDLAKSADDTDDYFLTPQARKQLLDSNAKATETIQKTTKYMHDLIEDRRERTMDILVAEMSDMITFYYENDQEYTAIGICPDCEQRIVMQTIFPTFSARYTEEIGKIVSELKEIPLYDERTIDEFSRRAIESINADAVADTYTTKFTREFEKTLQKGGTNSGN